MKAGRQLNALARISRYIDIKSKSILYHSFVASNFKYYPLVWHFCGVTSNNKLEKLQERSLRIIHKDYSSTYDKLLENTAGQTLALDRLKCILLEVFKSINKLNASCLHDMFHKKSVPYQFRTEKLEQPKRRTTRYGLKSLSYVGPHLWNYLLANNKDIPYYTYEDFKHFLGDWKGPDLKQYPIPLM